MGWINRAGGAVWSAGQALGGIFRPRAGTPSATDDFWYGPIGQPGHAGVRVTPDIALKASAVYVCVKVLAETIASLPLGMFRLLPNGGREAARNHPLEELIRYQPNEFQTAHEFWEMMVLHGALRGTGYAEIVPGPRGAVDQLKPLHSERVTPRRMADDSYTFEVHNPHTGAKRVLLPEELLRIPGMSTDGVQGLRAVDLAAEAIGLGMAADAYAARVFSNRANMGGYIRHPSRISKEAQENLIQALMERAAGIHNAHRPVVLQEGMDFTSVSWNARESQLIEARKWQIIEVARYWRIPLHMVGIDTNQPRANVEQESIDFVRYTLRPWVHRIERAIRRDLIVAKQTFTAKYNLEGLLRGDSAARQSYFSSALGASGRAAWMTPNEVREVEGLNPSDDPRADLLGGIEPGAALGDEPAPGASPDQTPPPAPPAPPPDEDEDEDEEAAAPDMSPRGRAERLVEMEIDAVLHPGRTVEDIYEDFAPIVAEVLDIPDEAARAYCDHACAEVLAFGDRNLDELLGRWRASRADEIAATIERHSQET